MVRFEPTSLLLAPSTIHRFDVVEPPLTETSEPPARPLSAVFRPSVAGDARLEQRELHEVAAVQRQLARLAAR